MRVSFLVSGQLHKSWGGPRGATPPGYPPWVPPTIYAEYMSFEN